MGSHGTAHVPYPSSGYDSAVIPTLSSRRPQWTVATAPPLIRQVHPSMQSAKRHSMPYQPQVKVPKSVSFGKKVIPAGAESSYLNQPTYASKASQPHFQGRESRRDERRTPPTGYSALRRKGKEASQRPLSQSTAPTSATLSARAKRIVEVP